jgi:hypothetical protein
MSTSRGASSKKGAARGRASKTPPADGIGRQLGADAAEPTTLLMVRDPGEGWAMPLDARARAIALDERGPDVAAELEELSLSRVRLEGLDVGEREVERLGALAQRGVRFAMVRGERPVGGRVAWLCFELGADEQRAADRAA